MKISQEYLQLMLHYDSETGIFTWIKTHPKSTCKVGERAGCYDYNGYVIIGLGGNPYKAHRLAWLYMTGNFPKQHIDHIDHNPSNNKWDNLREADYSKNNINRIHKNMNGLRGVTKTKSGKYRTSIRIKGKRLYLGLFNSSEEAHKAYINAAKKFHGEFAVFGVQK